MPPSGWEATAAALVAAVVGAALTPVSSRLARRVGAVDEPRERGLSDRPTPRLGGLAIFAGVLLAGGAFLAVRGGGRGGGRAGGPAVAARGGAGAGLPPPAPG